MAFELIAHRIATKFWLQHNIHIGWSQLITIQIEKTLRRHNRSILMRWKIIRKCYICISAIACITKINYRKIFLEIVSAEFGWLAAKWFLVTFGKFMKNASFEVNGVAPNIITA